MEGECVVEAGCWKGGSSAKLSLICSHMGYSLNIHDSFEGVERVHEGGHNFSGQYAASQTEVSENIRRYGRLEVCHLHKGWFADTLAAAPIQTPVRAAYIDCDLAKGTREVLKGVVHSIVPDGAIFTQDYHIKVVRKVLNDESTWKDLGCPQPRVAEVCASLARIDL
jgi:O-methyltransferase